MNGRIAIVFDDGMHEDDLFHRIQRIIIARQVRKLSKKHNKSGHMICINTPERIRDQLQGSSIIFKEYGNYYREDMFNENSSLISNAIFYAQNWYKNGEKDITFLQLTRELKVSLGRGFEHDLARDIYGLLLLYEVLDKLISDEVPDKIFVVYKLFMWKMVSCLAKGKKIEVVLIAPFFSKEIEGLFKIIGYALIVMKRMSSMFCNVLKCKKRHKRIENLGKYETMIFVSTPNPAQVLVPIMKKLQDIGIGFLTMRFDYRLRTNSMFRMIANLRTNVREKLKRQNLKSVRIESYGTLEDVWENIRFIGRMRSILQEIYENESMFYKNLDLREIVASLVRYHFYSNVHIVSFAKMSARALQVDRPKLIITANTKNWDGRIFTEIANMLNLQSLTIQEGLYGIPSFDHMFNSENIALYGDGVRDEFRKRGVEEGRMIVTGAPVYDFMKDRVGVKKGASNVKCLEKYGINGGEKLIVFASQPHDNKIYKIEEKRKMFRALIEVMPSLPNKKLVIKLHPYESDELTNGVRKGFDRNNVVVVKDVNIFDLIGVCDLLITKFSTSAMEAILLGKPVIIMNLGGMPDIFPYVENNVALGVYRSEDLLPAIKRILEGDKMYKEFLAERERFVRKFAFRLDGKATERVADLIRGMI